MKGSPILFSAPMIRALLEGRKTQTRRIVKPLTKRHPILNLAEHGEPGRSYSGRFNDPDSWGFPYAEDGADMALSDWINELCPYGKPGDLLYVKEAFRVGVAFDLLRPVQIPLDARVHYMADGEEPAWCGRYRHGRFMTRGFSRLTLQLTDVRVQRLNEISEEDAKAEGVALHNHSAKWPGGDPGTIADVAQRNFSALWESINGAGSWEANPWLWALTFRVHKVNVDELLKQREARAA